MTLKNFLTRKLPLLRLTEKKEWIVLYQMLIQNIIWTKDNKFYYCGAVDLHGVINEISGLEAITFGEINDETVKKMDELKKEMEALGRKKRDDILDEARTINNTVPDVKIRTKIPINMALDKVRSMTKLERDKLTIKQIRGVLDTIDVVYKTKGKLNKPYYMALMDKALEV